MFEEGIMDKQSSRQSSVPPKNNGSSSDNKKNDNNSPNRFSKYGRKKEPAGGGRGVPDFSRRVTPQKSKSMGDKRPRSRGYYNDRQREEVAEPAGSEFGSALISGSRKANLNHLLNFTFAARENYSSGSVYGGGRKPRYGGHLRYNKERFLQANCQFVVQDSEDYTVHSIDADILVDWQFVEQVRTYSYEEPKCPICLQTPLAAKITRCGHVYCWACILHYLALGEKSWRKCPICYESVHKNDLKSVEMITVHQYRPGETITMKLMKRERGSTYSVPMSQWEKRDGRPHTVDDASNTKYMKVLIASASQIQNTVIEVEKGALKKHLEQAEDSEVCFIEAAMTTLKEREESLHGKVEGNKKVSKVMDSTKLSEKGSEDKGLQIATDKEQLEAAVKADTVAGYALVISEGLSNKPGEVLEKENCSDIQEVDLEGAAGPLPVPVKRDSCGIEAPVGSPENPFPTSPMQQRMPETMATEEAAEQLELPLENNGRNDGIKTNKPKDAFYYYQANDGQHIYMHAINARCLMKEYGCLEHGPDTVTATIVAMESIFMTEDLRKRLRYLGHLPLTCEFQVVELALKPPILSKETLKIFADEIERRRRMRQRKARDDKKRSKKIEAEEKEKFGLYPGLSVSLDSASQFPAYSSMAADQMGSISSETNSTSSLSSLPTTPVEVSTGLNANAQEFIPGMPQSSSNMSNDGQQTSMSFAEMLKAGKAKPPSWPKVSEPVSSENVARIVKLRADSDGSENEDHVPVPEYQASFSSAVQAALESLDKPREQEVNPQRGKKKKQKQKLLFTTAMTRGK